MMSCRKRKTGEGLVRYQFRLRKKGFPPISKTFDRKVDGQAWIQEQLCATRAGTFIDSRAGEAMTVAELIETYIKETFDNRRSLHTPLHTLSWWKARIGPVAVARVTRHLIKHHWSSMKDSPSERTGKRLSDRTLNAYLETLSACFTYAVNEDLIPKNPVLAVPKKTLKNSRTRKLSDEELVGLLKAAKESSNRYLYVALLMSLSTGGRRGEVMGLSWKDANLKTGELFFRETKNDTPRTVMLGGIALDALREHAKLRVLNSSLIFPPLKPRRNSVGHVPWEDLRFPFKRACKTAGIENFKWHDLRHSAASFLMRAGASLAETMKVLGHKSAAMSWRYSHLDTKRMGELAASVDFNHLAQAVR